MKKSPPLATSKAKPLTQNGNGKPKPVKVIPVKILILTEKASYLL